MHESMPKYPCKNPKISSAKKIMQNLWQAPVQIKLNPGDALMTMQKQFQRGEYDTVSDHLESLSTSVPEILTAGRLNGQCSGLYG